jgi:hypothetical protein
VHLVLAAAKNLGKDFDRQRPNRKTDDAECGERLTAHGIHVGERVRGSDLPELVGIVDDGCEEVDGLNESQTVGQPEDSRIIEGLATDEDAGIVSRV